MVDASFFPSSCEEVALFPFFFEGGDCFSADVFSSDGLSPCEDFGVDGSGSEVGRGCSEVDDSDYGFFAV